jgi:hypothetical protein
MQIVKSNPIKMLNDNIGIMETMNLAKNPNIGEKIEILAHGFWLMLTIVNCTDANYRYEIIDSKGHVIKLAKIGLQCEVIDCQNLDPNMYLLNIYRNSKIIMGYRLALQNKLESVRK